ncbi:hypothetical protein H0H81_008383 [Sphagnurus paluster]|uniref:SMODS and SLOG-associating 2TM effector domain-containing protein n=1 Tax=Sphagnurus paluster TaxID=117069 RepID=A0A9P7FPY3_9AGAR|nr:hypothetical protein H0H81_008383 [Sphagnurus paluster]
MSEDMSQDPDQELLRDDFSTNDGPSYTPASEEFIPISDAPDSGFIDTPDPTDPDWMTTQYTPEDTSHSPNQGFATSPDPSVADFEETPGQGFVTSSGAPVEDFEETPGQDFVTSAGVADFTDTADSPAPGAMPTPEPGFVSTGDPEPMPAADFSSTVALASVPSITAPVPITGPGAALSNPNETEDPIDEPSTTAPAPIRGHGAPRSNVYETEDPLDEPSTSTQQPSPRYPSAVDYSVALASVRSATTPAPTTGPGAPRSNAYETEGPINEPSTSTRQQSSHYSPAADRSDDYETEDPLDEPATSTQQPAPRYPPAVDYNVALASVPSTTAPAPTKGPSAPRSNAYEEVPLDEPSASTQQPSSRHSSAVDSNVAGPSRRRGAVRQVSFADDAVSEEPTRRASQLIDRPLPLLPQDLEQGGTRFLRQMRAIDSQVQQVQQVTYPVDFKNKIYPLDLDQDKLLRYRGRQPRIVALENRILNMVRLLGPDKTATANQAQYQGRLLRVSLPLSNQVQPRRVHEMHGTSNLIHLRGPGRFIVSLPLGPGKNLDLGTFRTVCLSKALLFGVSHTPFMIQRDDFPKIYKLVTLDRMCTILNADRVTPGKTRQTVGQRLEPTLKTARAQRDKYASNAKLTGYTLNIAIGMQIMLGALTTGLSAATTSRRASLATAILGGLATLVASYLARSRTTNEPEQSIAHVKDLEHFIRECEAFEMDFGNAFGREMDEQLEGFRTRFEELLGNA